MASLREEADLGRRVEFAQSDRDVASVRERGRQFRLVQYPPSRRILPRNIDALRRIRRQEPWVEKVTDHPHRQGMTHMQRVGGNLDLVGEKRRLTRQPPDRAMARKHELRRGEVVACTDPSQDKLVKRAGLAAHQEHAASREIGKMLRQVQHPRHAIVEEMREVGAVERVLDHRDGRIDRDGPVAFDRTRKGAR